MLKDKGERWLFAAALATVAGCVDLIAYFVLYGVFTAHMSGNTVRAAAAAEQQQWVEAAIHAMPIPLFVAGVMLGVLIGHVVETLKLTKRYAPTLVLEAIALGGFIVLSPGVDRTHESLTWVFVATLATAVVAMGLQNATIRRVSGTNVRTTYITGMLTDFAEHVMKAILHEEPTRPALIAGSMWLAYLAGAGAGGVLYLHAGAIAMCLPAVLLLILAFVERPEMQN